MKTTDIFESVSKFSEYISEQLRKKALDSIEEIYEDLSGVSDEFELGFFEDDFNTIIKIANESGINYSADFEEFSIEIKEDDEDKLNRFFDELEASGIEAFEDTDDGEPEKPEMGPDVAKNSNEEEDALANTFESVDEAAAPKRKHTSATDKMAHKKYYRRNKAKIKISQRRYRKTAKYKRLQRLGKIKRRSGKTATGRRIVKRI